MKLYFYMKNSHKKIEYMNIPRIIRLKELQDRLLVMFTIIILINLQIIIIFVKQLLLNKENILMYLEKNSLINLQLKYMQANKEL